MRSVVLAVLILAACDASRLDVEAGADAQDWRLEIARRSADRRRALVEMGVADGAAIRLDACLERKDRQAAIACIRGSGPRGQDLRVLDNHGHETGLSVSPAACMDLWAAHRREVLDGCE